MRRKFKKAGVVNFSHSSHLRRLVLVVTSLAWASHGSWIKTLHDLSKGVTTVAAY